MVRGWKGAELWRVGAGRRMCPATEDSVENRVGTLGEWTRPGWWEGGRMASGRRERLCEDGVGGAWSGEGVREGEESRDNWEGGRGGVGDGLAGGGGEGRK